MEIFILPRAAMRGSRYICFCLAAYTAACEYIFFPLPCQGFGRFLLGVPPKGSGYDFVGGITANETPIRMDRYAGLRGSCGFTPQGSISLTQGGAAPACNIGAVRGPSLVGLRLPASARVPACIYKQTQLARQVATQPLNYVFALVTCCNLFVNRQVH